jgi:chromosomal replication initiator protein
MVVGLMNSLESSKDEISKELWQAVQPQLCHSFGEAVYRDWLSQLSCMQEDSNSQDILYLKAPSHFVKDWITTHYLETIETFILEQKTNIKRVIVSGPEERYGPREPFLIHNGQNSSMPLKGHGKSWGSSESVKGEESVKERSFYQHQGDGKDFSSSFEENDHPPLFQQSDLDPRFTFDNFVVGKPNEFAYAAARRVAESETATYNPLFLYGPVGHGKTHLMHAIAHHIYHLEEKKKITGEKQKTICYLSAEKFMYHFIRAIRYRDTVAFKERFRSVDILMVDDVQFISGKESTQEELFHTFNALVEQKRQVIFSADQSPSDLAGIQERMRSRLGWGLVADLHPTTYELRMGILENKADKLHVSLDQEILSFLAQKISSNVRELEGALTRLALHASLVGRPITYDMTQEVLRDLLRCHSQEISIDAIQKKVAEYYSIRLSDMHSGKRSRSIVRPRQMAMFLAKQMTTASLPEIGRKFGGRDHTTVLHGVHLMEKLTVTDLQMKEDLILLQRSLKS